MEMPGIPAYPPPEKGFHFRRVLKPSNTPPQGRRTIPNKMIVSILLFMFCFHFSMPYGPVITSKMINPHRAEALDDFMVFDLKAVRRAVCNHDMDRI